MFSEEVSSSSRRSQDDLPTPQKFPAARNLSSIFIIGSFVTNCAGGIFPTLPQPMLQAGIIAGATIIILTGAASVWSTYLIVKFVQPNSRVMLDDIISTRFPRSKKYIHFLSKSVSTLLYLSYCVFNFQLLYNQLQVLIFSRLAHWNTNYTNIIAVIITFFLSLIKNNALAVFLTGLIAVVPIVTLSGMTWYGFKNRTPESDRCFVEGWTHLSGGFLQSTRNGWYQLAQFGGVMLSAFYVQSSMPHMLAPSKKPHHNIRNTMIGFAIVLTAYFWAAMVGSLPFACSAFDSNATAPPSDYQTVFTHGGFAIFDQIMFLIAQLLQPPYVFMVLRSTCTDLIPWHNYRRRWRFVADTTVNAIVCIIAVLANIYGLSIQYILDIGAVGCTIIWCVCLPVFWDMYLNRKLKDIPRHCISILCSIFLIAISIGQYCF